MCWKKISYWLKGGIIGLVLAFIYNLIELILQKTEIKQWLLYLITDLIFAFIIGAIIGFISKMIKNNTSRKLPPKRRRKRR